MRKLKRYSIISASAFVILVFGASIGYYAGKVDIMCSGASPHVLITDMVSETGIVFPKGTIVPLKSCAYMQRFDWEFAIDNSVEVKKIDAKLEDENGFSLLEEVE